MPGRSGRNVPATASAQQHRRVGRERHGGDVRPRALEPARGAHDHAREPEIDEAGQHREHRGGRRDRRHQNVEQPVRIRDARQAERRIRGAAGLHAQDALEGASQYAAETLRVEPEIRNRHDDDERAEDRGPPDEASNRIPFERLAGGRCDRAREQRQIAEPPRRQADAEQEGEKQKRPNTAARLPAATSAATSPATWLQPSAAISKGRGAR